MVDTCIDSGETTPNIHSTTPLTSSFVLLDSFPPVLPEQLDSFIYIYYLYTFASNTNNNNNNKQLLNPHHQRVCLFLFIIFDSIKHIQLTQDK